VSAYFSCVWRLGHQRFLHQTPIYNSINSLNSSLTMFRSEQATQALSEGGLLPASIAIPTRDNTRSQYIAGLDNIGLHHMFDTDSIPTIPRRQVQSDSDLGIGMPPDLGGHDLAQLSSTVDARHLSLVKSTKQPITQLQSAMKGLVLGSPSANLQLSLTQSPHSHYGSSFQEVGLLGRGGFGRVYHTYNLFDQREYAIKKIPLGTKLSQKYRERGLQELQSSLREVQALATLDHKNVVRYHATWIEEPKRSSATQSCGTHVRPALTQKMLTGRPAPSPRPNISKTTLLPVADVDAKEDMFDRAASGKEALTSEGYDAGWSSQQENHDSISLQASDIFTDGNARSHIAAGNALEDDTVYVLHVQMSLYPATLAQYLAPPLPNASGGVGPLVKRHCFHLVPALRILLGILCGLQYIHAKGFIHRDIKPSNIFISALGHSNAAMQTEGYHDIGSCKACPSQQDYFVNPRIGDFGLVAELACAAKPGGSEDRGVGTEFYRPPLTKDDKGKNTERKIDEKVDVFAMGVVLVELLWRCSTTSERMFVLRDLQHGKLPNGLAKKINSEVLQNGLGEQVELIVKGMIHHGSEQRWGCERVKRAVEAILRQCDRKDIQTETERIHGFDGSEA